MSDDKRYKLLQGPVEIADDDAEGPARDASHDWHAQWVLTQSMLNESRAALTEALRERDEAAKVAAWESAERWKKWGAEAEHRAERAEKALRTIMGAADDLANYLDETHWCDSCEEFQERGKGEYCPLGQRIRAVESAYAIAAALAALDTTDGLAEKLGASHVEQHDSHAAAVRAGKARIDGLTTGPGGSDKPGRT